MKFPRNENAKQRRDNNLFIQERNSQYDINLSFFSYKDIAASFSVFFQMVKWRTTDEDRRSKYISDSREFFLLILSNELIKVE